MFIWIFIIPVAAILIWGAASITAASLRQRAANKRPPLTNAEADRQFEEHIKAGATALSLNLLRSNMPRTLLMLAFPIVFMIGIGFIQSLNNADQGIHIPDWMLWVMMGIGFLPVLFLMVQLVAFVVMDTIAWWRLLGLTNDEAKAAQDRWAYKNLTDIKESGGFSRGGSGS